MSIFQPIKDLRNMPAIKAELQHLLSTMEERDKQICDITAQHDKQILEFKKAQHLIVDDILTIKVLQKGYRGNEYQSYSSAVTEIVNKYNAIADWGVLQAGSIIDLRAAFIIGQGLAIEKNIEEGEVADAEITFCKSFLEYNDLDKEIAQEFAKEAEIEGKILLKLFWNADDQQIAVRFISWADKQYEVITDPQDYLWYKQVRWTPPKATRPETLNEPEFVYKKFGGRISEPNSACPKLMKCLTQIENLDKALRDLREINNLFAGPVPDIQCETPQEATDANDELKNINFGKIRKIFAHTGVFNYKQPTMNGVDSLIAEIEMLAKMISGTTGVPVHYLGLLDLLRNRATGENLYELLYGATSKEREIWKGAYKELITKAMIIYNTNAESTKQMSKEKQLDPNKINVNIPTISQEQWDRLEKVLLPAALGGKITDEYFLSQIPGMNIEEEMARKERASNTELDQARQQNEDLKNQLIGNQLKEQGGVNAIPK